MSKTTWTVIVSIAFTVFVAVIKVPEWSKPYFNIFAWTFLICAVAGWLFAHRTYFLHSATNPENVIGRTLRISKRADSIDEVLLAISNATSQNLPISELADNLACGDALPKIPQIEPHIIDDCRYLSSQQHWPEFSKIAKQLDGLNALVNQFNSEPNIARAKRILEESFKSSRLSLKRFASKRRRALGSLS